MMDNIKLVSEICTHNGMIFDWIKAENPAGWFPVWTCPQCDYQAVIKQLDEGDPGGMPFAEMLALMEERFRLEFEYEESGERDSDDEGKPPPF